MHILLQLLIKAEITWFLVNYIKAQSCLKNLFGIGTGKNAWEISVSDHNVCTVFRYFI